MAGDPNNANVWGEGDVLVLFDPPTDQVEIEATLPASVDDDFSGDWEYVGYLDGATGHDESMTSTTTDHSVWGGGVIRTSEKDEKLMRAFVARETNDVVERLARVGNRERVLIAFVVRDGDVETRHISRRPARVMRNGNVQRNEDALTGYPLQATLYPDTTVSPTGSAGEDRYFYTQSTEDTGS